MTTIGNDGALHLRVAGIGQGPLLLPPPPGVWERHQAPLAATLHWSGSAPRAHMGGGRRMHPPHWASHPLTCWDRCVHGLAGVSSMISQQPTEVEFGLLLGRFVSWLGSLSKAWGEFHHANHRENRKDGRTSQPQTMTASHE